MALLLKFLILFIKCCTLEFPDSSWSASADAEACGLATLTCVSVASCHNNVV